MSPRQLFILAMTTILTMGLVLTLPVYQYWLFHSELRKQGVVFVYHPSMEKPMRIQDLKTNESNPE